MIAEKPRMVLPEVPKEEPSPVNDGSNEDEEESDEVVEKVLAEKERENETEESMSSCYSSSEEGVIEAKESSEEKSWEDDEEEEEESGGIRNIKNVTIMPIEYNIESEDIKMCCVCNNIARHYDPKGEEEEGKKHERRTLLKGQNPYTEFPVCGCVAHFGCLIHSRWTKNSKSGNYVICPSCSEPESRFSLKEIRKTLKKTGKYKPIMDSAAPGKLERKKELAKSLVELLSNTGRKIEALKYSVGVERDYSKIWQYIGEGNVKFDDFMSLGWDMSQVYYYVTQDFTQLCNDYGFSLSHLSNEQTALGLAYHYEVSATDIKTKFQKDFTLKNLYSLNMTPLSMMALGINTHQLCLLGLAKDGIKHFENLSMRDWVEFLNFSKEHLHILGIRKTDFSNPKVLGMSYGISKKTSHSGGTRATSKPEGVLWSIEGLKLLLRMSDDELVKYGLGASKRGKMNNKDNSNGSIASTRRKRNLTKERRQRQHRNHHRHHHHSRHGETDYLLKGLQFEENRTIMIPSASKKKTTQVMKMPTFAPLSESDIRDMKDIEEIRKGV